MVFQGRDQTMGMGSSKKIVIFLSMDTEKTTPNYLQSALIRLIDGMRFLGVVGHGPVGGRVAVGAVPATTCAAVSPPQVVAGAEHPPPILDMVVDALNQRIIRMAHGTYPSGNRLGNAPTPAKPGNGPTCAAKRIKTGFGNAFNLMS